MVTFHSSAIAFGGSGAPAQCKPPNFFELKRDLNVCPSFNIFNIQMNLALVFQGVELYGEG
ncbi:MULTISPECIES: hypothetical protein [Trichocoleus]|uniref:Uncharacterized protein n=1 Tax=Trichocoleus desertorum GB2-A4 TaxID=2933944 RepID=A0ABV0JG09_9CYAN|nr:hypothetical protein [Trichocoleus sp. FACHB-46]MBD1865251.1 hypothetical protein [Trichocoleus sp. FACHB-46]